jgi:hypothetical protein
MPCTPMCRDCIGTEQMLVMMRVATQVQQRQRCLTNGVHCCDCLVTGRANKQAMAGAQPAPTLVCHVNDSQWDGTSDNDCNTACMSRPGMYQLDLCNTRRPTLSLKGKPARRPITSSQKGLLKHNKQANFVPAQSLAGGLPQGPPDGRQRIGQVCDTHV